MYDDFIKSGNLDKYYSKYYVKVFLRFIIFFFGLFRNVVIVLFIKVVDSLIVFNKKERESINIIIIIIILNERDIVGF